LHKEVKRRPQHLEKLHVTEFSGGAEGGVVKLRVGPDGAGAGFDVLYANEAPRVRMLRVTEQSHTANGANGAGEQPFDVDDEDARKLLALHGKLAKAATELAGHRRRLVDAKVDGEAMRTHAKPTLLPERLIAKMAPVVQEISARSHSPGELILRRLLAGDRREEIFLSKAELKQKLDPLSETNRGLFDPLWVSTLPSASAKAAPVETAPASGSAPHTPTGKYRPVTPALGTATLNASAAPAAVAAPVSGPPPAPAAAAAKVPLDVPAGDVMRRTLIGTTVPVAVQSAAVPPADSVSKTPLAAATHVEALRKEAAGTIEAAVAKQADPASRS
jgi:hypothetical protein